MIISYVFFLISYDIIEPEDGEWGVFTNGSSWTGLIGQLQKRVCINYCFHENSMLMFRHAKRETHEKKPPLFIFLDSVTSWEFINSFQIVIKKRKEKEKM